MASGFNALQSNSSGYANTACGESALLLNTTGFHNTAVGTSAMRNNTTASYNTATGVTALYYNAANYNTADGYKALYNTSTGSFNTGTGSLALLYNTTGYGNAAVGAMSLQNNTTGFHNAGYGSGALGSNITGFDNTAIGGGADVTYDDLMGATAIGSFAATNADDKIVIGTTLSNNQTGGYGNWQSFSDGRFKDNVQANVPGLVFVKKLHPVTYTLNAEKVDEFMGIRQRIDSCRNAVEKSRYLSRLEEVSSQLQTGFIAQEVEAAANSIGYNFDGVHHPQNEKDNYTIGYASFVVPLVKSVQELDAKNDAQQLKIENQELKIEEQQEAIDILKKQNELLLLRIEKLETK